jgi:carbamoyltransferase
MAEHQLADLSSPIWCSGFDRAMCLSYDAYGDAKSAALAVGTREGLQILETRERENSLGMFYVALTSLLGFQVGEDEYKLMGLAAYGTKGVDLSEFLHPVLCGYQCDSSFLPEDYRQRTMFEPFYSERLIALAGAPPSA